MALDARRRVHAAGNRRRRTAGLLLNVVAVVVGAVVTLGVTTVPAAAHDVLIATAPAEGARLEQAPGAVVLTFDEPALALGTAVVVTDAGGQQVQSGPPQLVDNTVTQPLRAGAPAGNYTVVWRVTSVDGHPISGRLAFEADAPAAGSSSEPSVEAPAIPAAAPSGPGAGGAAWVALLGVLAAVAVVLVLLRRRAERGAGQER